MTQTLPSIHSVVYFQVPAAHELAANQFSTLCWVSTTLPTI
jgi:hypothetical protein